MKPILNDDVWNEARVSAFWDRPKLSYEKWLSAVLLGNSRSDIMLKQSMLHMKGKSFVALIGLQAFIDHYRDWRLLLTDENPRTWTKKSILVSFWSWHTCGTIYMKNPTHEWFGLTKKQKETFYCISEASYESIYQIAKRMNRNYRRTFDDVKKLISLGIIQSRVKTVKGRTLTIVGL